MQSDGGRGGMQHAQGEGSPGHVLGGGGHDDRLRPQPNVIEGSRVQNVV
jgi:hypothetical protein